MKHNKRFKLDRLEVEMNPNIVYFPFGREATFRQFKRQLDDSAPEKPITEAQTVVIFGVARGGTTMAARVVSSLGIDLGEAGNINFEDDRFNLQKLGLNPNRDRDALATHLQRTIEQRNGSHSCWGWKYPNAASYLPLVLDQLRNPRLVCILRDPLASGSRVMRAGIRKGSDNQENVLLQSLRAMETNIALIHQCSAPTMLCSYEKAIQNPAQFVRSLAEFLGIRANKQMRDDALAQIQPGGYIQEKSL